MRRVLPQAFFAERATCVAPQLLGKYLVIQDRDGEEAYMITEVEAYDGESDKACHASKGRTARTDVLYGQPGLWYVYFIYGMYDMLNIVCAPEGYPSAVLIRSVEKHEGPGRLTRGLGITRTWNAKRATRRHGAWIEDRGVSVHAKDIVRTPRIGVAYAGAWAEKPWRYVLCAK